MDAFKARFVGINKRINELDAAIDAARGGKVVDLRDVFPLRDEREKLWREMQGLVSSAIGA